MKFINLFVSALALFTLCACSNGEYVVDLNKPVKLVLDDSTGPVVYVATATDNRLFIGSEAQPNLPSGEILSKDYKARAYARLKSFGNQAGAMLLPGDKTVASLIKEVIEQALSDSGYQVVSALALEDEQKAAIIALDIKQFWTYSQLDKINADIVNEAKIDVYIQQNNTQKKLSLNNKQTKKVLTDTKGQYQTTTEASLANIYHLACEKFPQVIKK